MKQTILFLISVITATNAFNQTFEAAPLNNPDHEKVTVKVGADFAMQYQMLGHQADSLLIPLGTGLNLPTANFTIDAALADGIKVNLTTYLSSRHHVEAWVKGGYLLMDKLPFLNSSVADRVMEYMTLKVGVMELNYGDAHFFRSDNGNVIKNPFVGNFIMDAFTTAPAMEALFRHNGWIAMAAVTTGTLKPELAKYSSFSGYTSYSAHEELAAYWKAGYDTELGDDIRLRATVSGYHSQNNHFGSLYNGDRTGSRFYLVMKPQTGSADDVDPASGHNTGRWGPGFTDQLNAYMINVFARVKGFELFGTYELNSGTSAFGGAAFNFNQIGVHGLYHFGKQEQFHAGIKYNTVSNSNDMSINRIEAGAGWNLTKNILIKLDYVAQDYTNFISTYGENAGFDGLMFEAAISF
ncbi:MAG: hypothetical protein K9G38_06460 [Bacteroidales bacterium]|nr:hypothetical protein [Bacteroidales bacterium]